METKEALVIQVAKDFPVPVDKLYQAWVTPDALKQWWQPMGNRLKEVKIDLKKGGSFRYVFENNNNQHAFEITGQYEEVNEAQRLIYSWNWTIPDGALEDSQFRLSISFINRDGGSRIEVVQENFKSEEALQPHREGWDKALNDLHRFLSSSGV